MADDEQTQGSGEQDRPDRDGDRQPKPTPPPGRDRRDDGDSRDRDDDRDDDGRGSKSRVLADLSNERGKRHAAESRATQAEARVAELERERMTEQERAVSERDEYRTKYQTAVETIAARELEILRMKVATEKGIPSHSHRLHGSTREELEKDADAFKADMPAAREKYIDRTAGLTSDGHSSRGSMEADVDAYVASRSKSRGDTNS